MILRRTEALAAFLLCSTGLLAACGADDGSSAARPDVATSATEPPVSETEGSSSMPPLREAVDPAIVSALEKAGLDLDALPADLGELRASPTKLRAVMRTFTIALGTTCAGCHASAGSLDYAAPTPEKRIAEKMWSELVVKLRTRSGRPLYCDSCHQGKTKLLDRADEGALGAWMNDNLVAKLERRDGKAHGCATCHGEPFNGDILRAWRN